MRRRDFVKAGAATLLIPRRRWIRGPRTGASSVILAMDDTQDDHLKAYGLAFRALDRGERGEWWLNFRGGSFWLEGSDALLRDAALSGVSIERVDEGTVTAYRGQIQAANMDAVPLEKVPKVAVYAPPDAAPWDDAVTMVAQVRRNPVRSGLGSRGHCGRPGQVRLAAPASRRFHRPVLEVRDHVGGAPWLQAMMQLHQTTAARLGFASVPELKRAVAQRIAAFVDHGGFLFAMCTATETLDLALGERGGRHRRGLRRRHADGSAGVEQDALGQGAGLSRCAARTVTVPGRVQRYRRSSGEQQPTGSRSARSRCSIFRRRSTRSPRCWSRIIAR